MWLVAPPDTPPLTVTRAGAVAIEEVERLLLRAAELHGGGGGGSGGDAGDGVGRWVRLSAVAPLSRLHASEGTVFDSLNLAAGGGYRLDIMLSHNREVARRTATRYAVHLRSRARPSVSAPCPVHPLQVAKYGHVMFFVLFSVIVLHYSLMGEEVRLVHEPSPTWLRILPTQLGLSCAMPLAFALAGLQDSHVPLDLAFLRTRVAMPYVYMLFFKHAFLPALDTAVPWLDLYAPWLPPMHLASSMSWGPMW